MEHGHGEAESESGPWQGKYYYRNFVSKDCNPPGSMTLARKNTVFRSRVATPVESSRRWRRREDATFTFGRTRR